MAYITNQALIQQTKPRGGSLCLHRAVLTSDVMWNPVDVEDLQEEEQNVNVE